MSKVPDIDAHSKSICELNDYIKENCIKRYSDGHIFTSRSGRQLDWSLDLKALSLQIDCLHCVARQFWLNYGDIPNIQLCGIAASSIPLQMAISICGRAWGYNCNVLYMRSGRKSYGSRRLIEGAPTGTTGIFVDDVLNSGSSLEKAVDAFLDIGIIIERSFVIASTTTKKRHTFGEINVASSCLFDGPSLGLDVANSTPITRTLNVAWRYVREGATFIDRIPKSTPLLIDESIVFGTESGFVDCLDIESGELKWSVDCKIEHNKGFWSSPASDGKSVYIGGYNGVLYSFDLQTGEEIWRNPCAEFIGSSPLLSPDSLTLFIGLEYNRRRSMGCNSAFDTVTGEVKWRADLTKYQHGSAVYNELTDQIIFGDSDHSITSYDAFSGQILWSTPTKRSAKYSPGFDKDANMVVASTLAGEISFLNADDGSVISRTYTDDYCYFTPVFKYGKTYVGSADKNIYIFETQTGKLIDKIDVQSAVVGSGCISENYVYFGTTGGDIIKIDTLSDCIEHIAQLSDAITNAPSIDFCGNIYVSTAMNEIYKITEK